MPDQMALLNARETCQVNELLSTYDVVDEAQNEGARVRRRRELLRNRYVYQPFQPKHHLRECAQCVKAPSRPPSAALLMPS